jgi:hypothetical protein
VVLLFDDMSAPSSNTRTYEQRRIERAGNRHQEIGDRCIEIEIGVETLLMLHDMVDGGRNFVPPVIAADSAQPFGLLLNDG